MPGGAVGVRGAPHFVWHGGQPTAAEMEKAPWFTVFVGPEVAGVLPAWGAPPHWSIFYVDDPGYDSDVNRVLVQMGLVGPRGRWDYMAYQPQRDDTYAPDGYTDFDAAAAATRAGYTLIKVPQELPKPPRPTSFPSGDLSGFWVLDDDAGPTRPDLFRQGVGARPLPAPGGATCRTQPEKQGAPLADLDDELAGGLRGCAQLSSATPHDATVGSPLGYGREHEALALRPGGDHRDASRARGDGASAEATAPPAIVDDVCGPVPHWTAGAREVG